MTFRLRNPITATPEFSRSGAWAAIMEIALRGTKHPASDPQWWKTATDEQMKDVIQVYMKRCDINIWAGTTLDYPPPNIYHQSTTHTEQQRAQIMRYIAWRHDPKNKLLEPRINNHEFLR